MRPGTRAAVVDRLGRFSTLVEVGIGRRYDVAGALVAAGHEVRATDVVERDVPTGVQFHADDITDPDPTVYAGADAIYALNLPPELHRPALSVARTHGTALAFTTLGAEVPNVPARAETLPGETLFWAGGTGHRSGDR